MTSHPGLFVSLLAWIVKSVGLGIENLGDWSTITVQDRDVFEQLHFGRD